MQAFHNDLGIKLKYLARIHAHREADNIIQGTGWENGKGCAVGCTLEQYNHRAYETELGLPEWIAILEDRIFENLPIERAVEWPGEFLSAINVGADLAPVRQQFTIWVLEGTLDNFDNGRFPDCVGAIRQAQGLWGRDDFGTSAWEAARSAAESAARSAARSAAGSAAGSAAWSAARSAAGSAAGSAAWSAAESAAESAAWSAAESAAWSAARSAAYIKFADKLLDLLRANT